MKLRCLFQETSGFACLAVGAWLRLKPHGIVEGPLLSLEQMTNHFKTWGSLQPPDIPRCAASNPVVRGKRHDPKDDLTPDELENLHVHLRAAEPGWGRTLLRLLFFS